MANIARGEARVLYLSRDPHQELYILCKQSGSALSVLLYFYKQQSRFDVLLTNSKFCSILGTT